jgi:outer membrane biosynthesis protein TonB
MRFSNLAVLAVVAPAASAFMPAVNQNAFSKYIITTSGTTTSSLSMAGVDGISTSDMDYENFTKKGSKSKYEQARKAPKAARVIGEKPAPKEKVVKEKAPPKPKVVKEKKVKAPPKPKPEKSAAYQFETPKPKTIKVTQAGVPEVAKPPTDSSTLFKGVALGAAPVILAPVAALALGRTFLTNTAARRQAIQDGLDEAKALKESKSAEVDFGDLFKAVVRTESFLCYTVLFCTVLYPSL